ncbi:MAG TPA: hypothetical protein VFX96_16145 [Pyrinomonadaceae bacterium]|nr:hypothetical protein [Pyrinomonadaceae bacterium]
MALAQQLKYCNRCGAQLVATKDADLVELFEKRMDSEMEGLFWITVLGLGLILGGMVLMRKVQLSEWLIIAYMAISSAAFVTYFGIGIWQVRRLARSSKEAKGTAELEQVETNELNPMNARASLEAAPSVTEHTTHRLEPSPKEEATR